MPMSSVSFDIVKADRVGKPKVILFVSCPHTHTGAEQSQAIELQSELYLL